MTVTNSAVILQQPVTVLVSSNSITPVSSNGYKEIFGKGYRTSGANSGRAGETSSVGGRRSQNRAFFEAPVDDHCISVIIQ